MTAPNVRDILRAAKASNKIFVSGQQLRSQRRLIELRIEHADLDSLIDRASTDVPGDELAVRRLKKRRLLLRDQMARIEAELDPPQPA